MKTFEELGLTAELTEALASEGIETPTPLQETAIPMIKKVNSLVLEASPGSGLLVAWSAGLLARFEPGAGSPRAVVLCASPEAAERLAESVARLGSTTGHAVATLGGTWVLPERADVVFGTVGDVLDGMETGTITADGVEAIVVDQAQLMEEQDGLEGVERVLAYLPEGTQRVLSAQPMTPSIRSLVDRLFKRTMIVPGPITDVPKRGAVRFRIVPEPREAGALAVVGELLQEGARHALVYCRSEDRAADVGDYLTLHGYAAGAPGDPSSPVWLGVDALEARAAVKGVEGVVVVSCDAPADPDTLDRRHAIGDDNVVVVLPREVAHLRGLGRRTGYDTVPFPPAPTRSGATAQLRSMVENAMETEDISPYLLALEPLFERFDPAEVAAAAVALLRRGRGGGDETATPGGPIPVSAAARATATPSWAKLFIGVGERDGLRKGDLVGAITGEAGVPGDAVGRIDVKESHSLVEVHDTVARKVIQALNGTTIKGRSARVDFDRPRRDAKKPRR